MNHEYDFVLGLCTGILVCALIVTVIICCDDAGFTKEWEEGAMHAHQGNISLEYTISDGVKTDSCFKYKN